MFKKKYVLGAKLFLNRALSFDKRKYQYIAVRNIKFIHIRKHYISPSYILATCHVFYKSRILGCCFFAKKSAYFWTILDLWQSSVSDKVFSNILQIIKIFLKFTTNSSILDSNTIVLNFLEPISKKTLKLWQ